MGIKKDWYEIVSPKLFGSKVIGMTLSVDPRYLKARTIQANTIDLMNDYSRFFIKINLQIENIEGNKAYTKFIGHECMRDRVARMVQRKTRKVEIIEDVKTKDDVRVRIKTLVILSRRVNTSIKSKTRHKVAEIVQQKAAETKFDDLIMSMISGSLQKYIKDTVKKIYPISGVEIRKSEVLIDRIKQTAKRQTKKVYAKTTTQGKKKGGKSQ
ncbi:MAG: 30S ribosomal protein S3ae [Candidatus Aenigmarchaeota archaeon]|nr:30S ribosomal protein S3ae [Candidatus Aenigmarchaeota archaeon]